MMTMLNSLIFDVYNSSYINLEFFNNNNIPSLLNLTIPHTKLSSMINNTFSSLIMFNITNSRFNDTGLLEIITNNTWHSPSYVKFIDISMYKLIKVITCIQIRNSFLESTKSSLHKQLLQFDNCKQIFIDL